MSNNNATSYTQKRHPYPVSLFFLVIKRYLKEEVLLVERVVNPEDIGKILPWVHLAISNAKSLLTDIYHGIKPEFLREYLNEFCYKFNRRYFGEHQFDRLLIASASYSPDFEHKLYNKHITKKLGFIADNHIKLNAVGEALFFASKIFVSYGIYQTISAFRKYGK